MTPTKTEGSTRKKKTERLNEMAFAFKKAGTLLAAIEFNLFGVIDGGASTLEAIAEGTGLEIDMAERLLIVCKSLDLVRGTGGAFENVEDVDRYLVPGKPAYFGDYLLYQARSEYDGWKNISDGLRPAKNHYFAIANDPVEARKFTVAGYNSSIALAHKNAKEFDFSRFKLFVDLGGGSGCYSIAACTRNPDLKAIVMDFPAIVEVTKEFIEKAGLEDRISTVPGSFFDTEIPKGADLISYIGNLQAYMPDQVRFLAKRAYEALEPGGTILMIDYMLRDDKSGPLDPAFLNLGNAVRAGGLGRVNSGAEFQSYLEAAGFTGTEVSWLTEHQLGRITGVKPG